MRSGETSAAFVERSRGRFQLAERINSDKLVWQCFYRGCDLGEAAVSPPIKRIRRLQSAATETLIVRILRMQRVCRADVPELHQRNVMSR